MSFIQPAQIPAGDGIFARELPALKKSDRISEDLAGLEDGLVSF